MRRAAALALLVAFTAPACAEEGCGGARIGVEILSSGDVIWDHQRVRSQDLMQRFVAEAATHPLPDMVFYADSHILYGVVMDVIGKSAGAGLPCYRLVETRRRIRR